MTAYLTGLVAISCLVGICSYISYGESQDKCLKAAASLILVYVVVFPLLTLVREAGDYRIYDYTYEFSDIPLEDTQFGKSAEEAFGDGVRRYVSERFSLSENDVSVAVFGFDSKNMKAREIKIVLSGKAIFADNRAIAECISESGIGECEVELSVK